MSNIHSFGYNDVKVNEFGFPVTPEKSIIGRKTGNVKVSNSQKGGNGLKGYIDDPTFMGRPHKNRGILLKTIGLDYHIQRKISREFVVFSSIMKLRISQGMPFCQPSEDEDIPGMRVKLKDKNAIPTKQEKREMDEVVEFVYQTGRRDFPESVKRKDRMPQFMQKIFRDSLALDRVALAIRKDRTGELTDWALMDPETIKPVDPYIGFDNDKDIKFVQEINGIVTEKYKDGEIIVDWMYQTTDIENQHFGWSGIEETFKEIKSTIESLRYNSGNFTKNKSPEGFFSTGADLEEEDLDELEDRFNSIFTDPASLHKVLFFAGDENFKWNPIRQSNKDMEFDNYMQLLISLLLMNYGVDPDELGLKLNKAASIFGDSGTNQKQDKSKDRGLGALLDFTARVINALLEMSPKYNKYAVYHTGRQNIDKDKRIDLDIKKISNTQSIYSYRKENDIPQLWEEAEEMFTKGASSFDDEEKKEIIKNLKKDSLLILNAQYLQGRSIAQQEEEMGEEEMESDENGENGYSDEEEINNEEENEYEEIDDEEISGSNEKIEKSRELVGWAVIK